MKTFTMWVENLTQPESEGMCSLVALSEVLPIPKDKIKHTLKKWGLTLSSGVKIANLTLALDELGVEWSIKGTGKFNRMTPKELLNSNLLSKDSKYLLVMNGHVIPMRDGKISNLCGYGDSPIQFVITIF